MEKLLPFLCVKSVKFVNFTTAAYLGKLASQECSLSVLIEQRIHI